MAKLVSKMYYEALFESSVELDILDEVNSDFNFVYESLKEHNEFFNILKSPLIKPDEKKNILRSTYKVSEVLMDFLCLLVDKKRIEFIYDIYGGFNEAYNYHKKIGKAEVISAKKLDDLEIKALTKKLNEITKKDVTLTNTVNPNILGGLIVKMDGKVIDGSLIRKLEGLKKELTKIVI